MYHIYLDESGDLGFSSGASKFFVLAFIFTEESSKKIRRIIKDIKVKHSIPPEAELKASKSRWLLKEAVLQESLKINYKIRALIINKSLVYKYLQQDTNILYNYLSKVLILDFLTTLKGETEVIFDQRTVKVTSGNSIYEYLQAELYFEKKYFNNKLTVKHVESNFNYFIQLADFVSNAIYKKYEKSEVKFYDVIKSRIDAEICYLF